MFTGKLPWKLNRGSLVEKKYPHLRVKTVADESFSDNLKKLYYVKIHMLPTFLRKASMRAVLAFWTPFLQFSYSINQGGIRR